MCLKLSCISISLINQYANFVLVMFEVANFFYWYLKVETEDPTLGEMFQRVFDVFLFQLRISSAAGALFERKLLALNEYIDTIIRYVWYVCTMALLEITVFHL